jgi:hypothetical protein
MTRVGTLTTVVNYSLTLPECYFRFALLVRHGPLLRNQITIIFRRVFISMQVIQGVQQLWH